MLASLRLYPAAAALLADSAASATNPSALRAQAPGKEPLAIEVLPRIAGVSEAAAILGWDKRRVMTYVRRGSFPEPFAHLASGRIWRREDVEAFAASKRKRS